MKIKINTDIIKQLKPCIKRFDNWLNHYRDFEGDITKFLKLKNITHEDKLWVALRLVPLEMRVVFALDCSFAAAAYAASADAEGAAYAAEAATYAAYAAETAAVYAAEAATYAASADAEGAAVYAAGGAAYAARAEKKAQIVAKQSRQIEALIYLIKGE